MFNKEIKKKKIDRLREDGPAGLSLSDRDWAGALASVSCSELWFFALLDQIECSQVLFRRMARIWGQKHGKRVILGTTKDKIKEAK